MKTPNKTTYTLEPGLFRSTYQARSKQTLLVSAPTASPGYETKKMLYNKKPFEISAYAKNQWAGPPAKMLQPLLIQRIRDTGYFYAVVAPPLSANKNWLLKTNLLELRQDFTRSPSCIHMAIQADIIDKSNNDVIDSKVFTTSIITTKNTPYGGVIAANEATRYLLDDIAQFCVNAMVYMNHVAQLPTPVIPAKGKTYAQHHSQTVLQSLRRRANAENESIVIPANAGISIGLATTHKPLRSHHDEKHR